MMPSSHGFKALTDEKEVAQTTLTARDEELTKLQRKMQEQDDQLLHHDAIITLVWSVGCSPQFGGYGLWLTATP